jgi:hypothetical protein
MAEVPDPNRGRGMRRGRPGGRNSARATNGGRNAAPFRAAEPKFRPHLGEFPKIVLPMGADGVRITHYDGVTYAEYHFSHVEEDGGWIPASSLKGEQDRSFDLHLANAAARLDPPVELGRPDVWVGNQIPPERSGAGASKKGGNAVVPQRAYGSQWWKSHLKPEVYHRIFPAATGSRRPSPSTDGENDETPEA